VTAGLAPAAPGRQDGRGQAEGGEQEPDGRVSRQRGQARILVTGTASRQTA
jgi:hypothetical protein